MTINIVELLTDNSQLLASVADEVFDHAIDTTQLMAFLACPRHSMVLAIDDGIVIGMASAVEYFHPDKPPQLWINEVAVAPPRRNEGIGRQLVEALIEIGKRKGCVCAWLGTDCGNFPAQRCFAAVSDGVNPTEFLLYEWKL